MSRSIVVETQLDSLTRQAAALRPIDESQLSLIGLWAAGDFVDPVPRRDQADVQAIMSSGLGYSTLVHDCEAPLLLLSSRHDVIPPTINSLHKTLDGMPGPPCHDF